MDFKCENSLLKSFDLCSQAPFDPLSLRSKRFTGHCLQEDPTNHRQNLVHCIKIVTAIEAAVGARPEQ